MNTLPTLRQLQYLVALEDHRSFHKAAEACNISQPTLSAGIKELESLMLQPVVMRRPRSITLTPSGAELAKGARELLKTAETLTYQVRRQAKKMTGSLRMGVIPTIAPYLLPRAVPRLQAVFKDMDLTVHEGRTADILQDIEEGKLDFAFMAFPHPTRNMKKLVMFEEPFHAAFPAVWTDFNGRESLDTGDFRDRRLLLLDDGHCLRDHALDACGLNNNAAEKGLRAASLGTLIEMVRAGYGMTLLPDMAVKEDVLPAGIRTLPMRAPAMTRKIGFAWPVKSYMEEDITMAFEILKDMFKDKRPRFSS